jgi:hypothetical protein
LKFTLDFECRPLFRGTPVLLSDDVWTLEQFEELGQARQRAARQDRELYGEPDEADVTVDLAAGTVSFDG